MFLLLYLLKLTLFEQFLLSCLYFEYFPFRLLVEFPGLSYYSGLDGASLVFKMFVEPRRAKTLALIAPLSKLGRFIVAADFILSGAIEPIPPV